MLISSRCTQPRRRDDQGQTSSEDLVDDQAQCPACILGTYIMPFALLDITISSLSTSTSPLIYATKHHTRQNQTQSLPSSRSPIIPTCYLLTMCWGRSERSGDNDAYPQVRPVDNKLQKDYYSDGSSPSTKHTSRRRKHNNAGVIAAITGAAAATSASSGGGGGGGGC